MLYATPDLLSVHTTAGGRRTFEGERRRRRLARMRPSRLRMSPIVEAAGYRVVGDDQEGHADLVIASQGEEVPGDVAKRTIWLRSDPDAANKKDTSIYRYDRAGLLMALKSTGTGRGR